MFTMPLDPTSPSVPQLNFSVLLHRKTLFLFYIFFKKRKSFLLCLLTPVPFFPFSPKCTPIKPLPTWFPPK